MNPILKRTLCGLGVGALVIGLFLYCPLRCLMPVILVLSTFAQLEFYAMAKKQYEPVTWFGLLMGVVLLVWVGLAGFGNGGFGVFVFFAPALLLALFVLCLFVLFRSRYRNPIGSIAVTLMGFLYVPFLLSFFLLIAQLTGDGWWGFKSSVGLCADCRCEVLRYRGIRIRHGIRQAQDVPNDLAEEIMGRAGWLNGLLGGDGGGDVVARAPFRVG